MENISDMKKLSKFTQPQKMSQDMNLILAIAKKRKDYPFLNKFLTKLPLPLHFNNKQLTLIILPNDFLITINVHISDINQFYLKIFIILLHKFFIFCIKKF